MRKLPGLHCFQTDYTFVLQHDKTTEQCSHDSKTQDELFYSSEVRETEFMFQCVFLQVD